MRVYRIPFSTNVERVALALAHKGLDAEAVMLDPADRSPVVELSGQDLVPVIEHDGRVIADSPLILEYLEELRPEPRLFPAEEPRRVEMEIFIDWFNAFWKAWPNAIEAELGQAEPNEASIADYSTAMDTALDHFERMLTGRDHMFGDEFSAADCIAFPFLKYALKRDPEDDELFHRILDEHQSVDGRPRLRAWIERVDERPRV